MDEKNHNKSKIKKKIEEYKKRLDNLKLQGFIFSKEIYDDIDEIEGKIFQKTLYHQLKAKNLQLLVAILIIIVTTIGIYLWLSQPQLIPPSVEINNFPDGIKITDDFTINGTILNASGPISALQATIDNTGKQNWNSANLRKNSNGTYNWNYTLKKDKLTNGTHFIYFRCYYYGEYTIPISRWFEFNKTILRPIVAIENPKNGKKIWGLVEIEGTTKARNGSIEKVEFKIGNESYKPVNGTTNWNVKWNTSRYENDVVHTISVRCMDNNGVYSEEASINVYIENIPPDGSGGIVVGDEKFQIHFWPKTDVMPNYNYTISGFHLKEAKIFNYNQWTTFDVEGNYEGIEIITPEEYLVTPSDGQEHSCSFTLRLTDEAKPNTRYVIMMVYQSGQLLDIYNPNNNPQLWEIISKEYRDEYYFITGQW